MRKKQIFLKVTAAAALTLCGFSSLSFEDPFSASFKASQKNKKSPAFRALSSAAFPKNPTFSRAVIFDESLKPKCALYLSDYPETAPRFSRISAKSRIEFKKGTLSQCGKKIINELGRGAHKMRRLKPEQLSGAMTFAMHSGACLSFAMAGHGIVTEFSLDELRNPQSIFPFIGDISKAINSMLNFFMEGSAAKALGIGAALSAGAAAADHISHKIELNAADKKQERIYKQRENLIDARRRHQALSQLVLDRENEIAHIKAKMQYQSYPPAIQNFQNKLAESKTKLKTAQTTLNNLETSELRKLKVRNPALEIQGRKFRSIIDEAIEALKYKQERLFIAETEEGGWTLKKRGLITGANGAVCSLAGAGVNWLSMYLE